MSKKKIVSLILIVLVLMIIADFKINGSWVMESYFRRMGTNSLENINDFNLDNIPHASDNSTLTIKSSGVSSLSLRNALGSVSITGEDRDNIKIDYKITVYAKNEKDAGDFLQKLSLDKKVADGDLEIFLKKVERSRSIRGIKVDYKIRAPKKMILDIKNRHGKLKVNDFNNNVVLENYYDDMLVNNIKGRASIRARYGNLYLSDVQGATDIETAYNKADVKKLGSDLSLDSSYSSVDLDNVSGKVVITGKYGSSSINSIASDVEIDARYTEVKASGVKGTFDADLRYGALLLTDIENDLDVNGNYTDVEVHLSPELNDLTLDCQARYGDITTGFDFPVVKSDNIKELRGSVGNGKIKINLETSYGDIAVN